MDDPIEQRFRDEHGFLDPEAAASHAIIIQGGFSTAEIEADRMIADGGVAKLRAEAWRMKVLIENLTNKGNIVGVSGPGRSERSRGGDESHE